MHGQADVIMQRNSSCGDPRGRLKYRPASAIVLFRNFFPIPALLRCEILLISLAIGRTGLSNPQADGLDALVKNKWLQK